MKRPRKGMATLLAISILVVRCVTPTVPTLLVLRMDETFEEVAAASTYPVRERSNRPSDDPSNNKSGVIWVTKPAVIIRYDDPVNGFTLPPTKFAGVFFMDNRAQSIETSPMLEPLPFAETAEVFRRLQEQFRAKGWMPMAENYENTWIDLSDEGKRKLHHDMYVDGMAGLISVGVPKKNVEVMLRMKCFDDCDNEGNQEALFLIDVGVGPKALYDWDGE